MLSVYVQRFLKKEIFVTRLYTEQHRLRRESFTFIAMRRAHAADYNHGMAQRSDQVLEEENDRLVDNLSSKVKALKSLSIDIGDEVRTQNKLLNEMDSDFDASGSLLAGTMGRLSALVKKGHHKIMCYVFMFCMFVFFVAWYIVKRR